MIISAVEIPCVPQQPRTFSLQMGGITYQCRQTWNYLSQNWNLDIAERDGTPIVSGIPLVTGANLMEQLGCLLPPFGLYAASDFDADAVPTFENLGTTGHLYAVVRQ